MSQGQGGGFTVPYRRKRSVYQYERYNKIPYRGNPNSAVLELWYTVVSELKNTVIVLELQYRLQFYNGIPVYWKYGIGMPETKLSC